MRFCYIICVEVSVVSIHHWCRIFCQTFFERLGFSGLNQQSSETSPLFLRFSHFSGSSWGSSWASFFPFFARRFALKYMRKKVHSLGRSVCARLLCSFFDNQLPLCSSKCILRSFFLNSHPSSLSFFELFRPLNYLLENLSDRNPIFCVFRYTFENFTKDARACWYIMENIDMADIAWSMVGQGRLSMITPWSWNSYHVLSISDYGKTAMIFLHRGKCRMSSITGWWHLRNSYL